MDSRINAKTMQVETGILFPVPANTVPTSPEKYFYFWGIQWGIPIYIFDFIKLYQYVIL